MGDTANKVSLTDFYAPPPPHRLYIFFAPPVRLPVFFFRIRTFIFHKCIPLGKSFLWYQGQGHLSRSNIKVTILEKMAIAEAFAFHKPIPVLVRNLFIDENSYLLQIFVFLC